MKNKEIQELRIKDYFIQATKDILKSEGIKAISVRNISDKAGYSYATLYNYFKDVNDLIFLCVSDFQAECLTFVKKQTKGIPNGREKIKALALSYINYFLEYPGIFELFYISRVGDFNNKQSIISLIDKSLDSVCESDWNYCVSHNQIEMENLEFFKSQLKLSTVGLLLFYLNRLTPPSYSEFISHANKQTDDLLGLIFGKQGAVEDNGSKNPQVQNSFISINIK